MTDLQQNAAAAGMTASGASLTNTSIMASGNTTHTTTVGLSKLFRGGTSYLEDKDFDLVFNSSEHELIGGNV